MESELKDLENSQPIHVEKKTKKTYFKENTMGVAEQSFDKEISMGMKDKFNQPVCSRCQE